MPSYAAPPAPAAVSLRSDSSQIETFGFYWAMQDGSNNVSAPNGRNCSRDAASEGRCSWSHATSAFVQNSWKHPNRWTSNSTAWDVQDVLQLGNVNVTSIVSVSHVFVSFGANGSGYVLLPNYEASWAAYLHEMQASGALQNINAWYPADEPDIKMDAAALNTIVHALKRDTPHIKVLVTLSSLAVPPFSAGTSQRFNISAVSSEVDVITMDMYCAYSVVHKKQPACQILWPTMLAKLEGLASFAAQNKATQLAVIPDATLATASTIGAAAQRTLNDLFLMWCSNQAACTAVLPFVGGQCRHSGKKKKKNLPTENLLEDTGGMLQRFGKVEEAPHPCPLGAVARCSLILLTCTLRMTSSHSKASGPTCPRKVLLAMLSMRWAMQRERRIGARRLSGRTSASSAPGTAVR